MTTKTVEIDEMNQFVVCLDGSDSFWIWSVECQHGQRIFQSREAFSTPLAALLDVSLWMARGSKTDDVSAVHEIQADSAEV